MANRRSIEQKIEKLKQMASLGLAESEQLHRHRIRAENVTRWLVERLKGIEPPPRFALIAGGHSNGTRRLFRGRLVRVGIRRLTTILRRLRGHFRVNDRF
jgi:hypothetical protein